MRALLIYLLILASSGTLKAQDLELVIPRGHTNPVVDLTTSADKKFIVSSDGTNELVIWSSQTRRELVRHALSSPVQDIKSVGATTYIGLGDGKLYGVNYQNLELDLVWEGSSAIKAIAANDEALFMGLQSGLVYRRALSGNKLDSIKLEIEVAALLVRDENLWLGGTNGKVFKISFSEKTSVREASIAESQINHLEFLSEGYLFASDNRGYIHQLNEDLETVNSVQVFGLRARQFIVESDSTLLVVGRDDFSNLRRVNFTNWQVSEPGLWQDEFEYPDFPLGLYAIRKFSDAEYLISGYEKDLLRVDSLGNKLQYIGEASNLTSIALDPSGIKLALATGKNEIQIIDLTGARNPKYFNTATAPTSFAWHDQRLYAGLADGKLVIIDGDSLLTSSPGIAAEYPSTAISLDASAERFLRKFSPESISLLSVKNGKAVGTIKKAKFEYQFLKKSDALIYLSSKDKLVRLDANSLKKQLIFDIDDVSDFKLSTDEAQLVARSGKSLHFLNPENGISQKVLEFKEVFDDFYLSPDGNLIYFTQASRLKGSTETNYLVAVYDNNGEFKFKLEGHTARITDLEFIKNGQFVLTAAADGVIKIWQREGQFMGNLIPLSNGEHTIIAAGGQFDATLRAMDKLSYRQGSESIKLEQVKSKYFEPGILAKMLGFKQEPIEETEPLKHVKLYPEFDLTHPMHNDGILGINVKAREGGTGRIVILINGKEAPHNVNVSAQGHAEFDVMNHPYILTGDLNKISVKIYNESGDAVSSPRNIFYLDKQKPEDVKPHLFGLVVGVSDYHGDNLDLKYAAKDANDIAKAIEISAKEYLGADNVHMSSMTTINDSSSAAWPNKRNIMARFDSIAAQATPRDILFLYLSGHGEVDEDSTGEFYYLTADAGSGNFNDPRFRQRALLSNYELIDKLQLVPTLKQVMIVDACHSGSLVSTFSGKNKTMSSTQVKSLETLKDRANIFVLAGSAEDAVSYESSIYGQGLLTYSLLMGMKGPALRNDHFVDILQLFNYASNEVPELAKDIGGIQKPEIRIPQSSSFDIGEFSDETKKNINLNSPKPIFIHSVFQHEEQFVDVLSLGRIIDAELRVLDNATDAEIVFLNTTEYNDAFAIHGRYRIHEAGGLSIKVKLFKDKSQIKAFEVEAANAGIARKEIVEKVLQAIRPLLNK